MGAALIIAPMNQAPVRNWEVSYRRAFIFFTAVFVVCFAPVLFRGQVIFAHNNRAELGITDKSKDKYISNRLFSDQSSAFIPELTQQLRGHSRIWISTWNPHVELGRPTAQLGGLGKAFLLTHVLSFLIP